MKIYDEESFLDDTVNLIKSKLSAKLTEINADKNDGIILEDIPLDRFVEGLDDEILNYPKFVFYGINNISPISVKGASAMTVSIFFDLIFMDDQGNFSKTVRKKVQRYTRAMREIINENYRKLSFISDIQIESISPTDLSNQSGTVAFKVAGIQVSGTIG